jgi:hypothetical protein
MLMVVPEPDRNELAARGTLAASPAWKVRTYGTFTLISPEGVSVGFPHSKIEALFVVLLHNQRYGIKRSDLGDIVWPGKDRDRQGGSLRQALCVLRAALGEDCIEATRSHCRLVGNFQIQSNPAGGTFMPGHDGAWFEDIRLEHVPDWASVETPISPLIKNSLETLSWLSEYAPSGFFGFLLSSPGVARGLGYRRLRDLLSKVRTPREFLGWYSYYLGAAEDDLTICEGHLRSALQLAKREEDIQLASMACLELGKLYARTRRDDRADKACKLAEDLARHSRSKSVRSNTHRLVGTVLGHRGDPAGILRLKMAEELIQDEVDLATARTARALMEVTFGQPTQACQTLATIPREFFGIGHSSINTGSQFVELLVKIGDDQPEVSLKRLQNIRKTAQASGGSQFVVYADELVARILVKNGEQQEGQKTLARASAMRNRVHMAMTKMERRRFEMVH